MATKLELTRFIQERGGTFVSVPSQWPATFEISPDVDLTAELTQLGFKVTPLGVQQRIRPFAVEVKTRVRAQGGEMQERITRREGLMDVAVYSIGLPKAD